MDRKQMDRKQKGKQTNNLKGNVMNYGKVIFLNGTSSSGKTTLAHALQEMLDEPYQHMALDHFRDGLPAKYRGLNSPVNTTGQLGLNVVPVQTASAAHTEVRFGEKGKQMLRGMRRAIAAMARSGNNIIIDDIILEPEFLSDYLIALSDFDVYFVGIRCPIATIGTREALRPGRFPGTAEGHFDTCHAHEVYDVEVDTATFTPEECAARVLSRLQSGPPTAFVELAS
jgi:chloramphenicol 3-O phosphotransferase